jgi:hypothetical protein
MMREEYDARVNELARAFNELQVKHDEIGTDKGVVSPGLKVRHKKSGLLYTVVALGMRDFVLRNPEGEEFTVNHASMEKEYELD